MQKDLRKSSTLYADVRQMIEEARSTVAQTVNAGLTMLYWNIGKRIKDEILQNKRAGYGEKIVVALADRLVQEYGKGFSAKNIRRMIQFCEVFPDFTIVASLMRQLSWTHFTLIIPIKNSLERDFYAQMCRIEKWSVRELRKQIDSMLFERTAISKKPEELAKLELQELHDTDAMSPDLVFRNPYILDFLDLKDTFQEKDLERAILDELEKFILEMGKGFAFVERQKRMVIDDDDFYLDLLFYHRKLKRLVAVDLKIGKFKAEYKGKMELYLRWLEKHETEAGEEQPIGLILCTAGNSEQVELLQLDHGNIRVAEYITEYLPKKLLQEKLHLFYERSKRLIENRE